jgi:hypothetical protein
MNKQVAQAKYFVAMAYDVDNVHQSDYLHLVKLSSGRVAGYASEFEAFTYDIEDACSAERTHFAKWFSLPDEEFQVTPATLEEIKSLGFEKCLIGSKKDMKIRTPIDPV